MSQPLSLVRTQPFAVGLGGAVLPWLVLALLTWLSDTTTTRLLLAAYTGALLLAGVVWYSVARLTGPQGTPGWQRRRRPIVLLGVAWLLACCSAFAGGFSHTTSKNAAGLSHNQDAPPKPALPPSKLFPKGPLRFLTELDEFDVKSGPLPFRKNGDAGDGKRIVVAGVESPHGIGMHPPWAPAYASAKFRLGKEAVVFKTGAAIVDSVAWGFSPAIFTVLGDGRELWKSEYTGIGHHRSHGCTLNVTGVDVLELRVQAVNGSDGMVSVWVEPRLFQSAELAD